jgi:Uma2 family endonuclease
MDMTAPDAIAEAIIETPLAFEMTYSSNVIAENVTFEEFLTGKYGPRTEWIFGKVIQMTYADIAHVLLLQFLESLLRCYLEMTSGGLTIKKGLVHRPDETFPGRVPDIMVVLPEKQKLIKRAQFTGGAADLIIEVVSPYSQRRDYVEKFLEYERAGVPEYWVLDPITHQSQFWVLNAEGKYAQHYPIEGVYTSTVFNRLTLPVALLWQSPLPTLLETITLVQKMLM